MAIFDGHNDLLLNLWLHHREDPVTAFFAGIENGHLDYPRILQGVWPAACSPSLCRRRSTSPVWRRSTPARRGIH